ncbi:hypothetical protein [Natrialba taiwanensis]|uniref:Portal protein n=1 Tax=Natrialba taiwanensis DSM 12281 TaxID=1230458 RepID=L9ZY82_9EURY|nr:hypothetical protein [Natrialba taiwanensis]ELY91465.1 hypothetical protein C484_10571 [Natrialba taiwanensis DSM 12281]
MGLRDKLTAMLQAAPQTVETTGGGPVDRGNDIQRDTPPKDDYHTYRRQYRTNPFVAAALDIRASETVRPGYRIEADDDSLKQELEDWAREAAYYAGESGEDLSPLLWTVARDHDLDGIVLAENVWDDPSDPSTLEGVKQFDPAQTDFLTPDNSSMLFPADEEDLPRDEEGNRIAPEERTPSGKIPSAVQYPEGWGFDENENYLSQDDYIKLTRSPGFSDKRAPGGNAPKSADFGPNRGVSLVESISAEVDRMEARSQDYNASIAAHAYPRLKVQFEDYERGNEVVSWDREKIADYMGKLTREGDNKKYSLDGDWVDPGGSVGSPPGADAELIEGSVPDVIDSLHYSVDYILSGLRVPKALVGFGDNINRDITGDQRGQFEQDIYHNRRKIERKFLTPLFRMKAREIRGDGPFDESVDVSDVTGHLEPEDEENPLKDEDFDAQEFKTMMEGVTNFLDSGADVYFEDVTELLGEILGMDLEEYAVDPEELEQELNEMGPLDDGQDPDIPEEGDEPPEPPEEQGGDGIPADD